MSLIMIHHFLCHGITIAEFPPNYYNLINPYFYTGVNIFFVISGWFLIRFSLKKLFSFITLVFLFCILNYILSYFAGEIISIKEIIKIILWPISNSPYWFLQVYLFLMLTAPIVNKGLQNLSLNQLRLTMALMTIGTIYSCCLGGNISNTGYCFLQGLYMYCIGYYIKTDKKFYNRIKPLWCYLGYFLLICIGSILTINSVYFPCNQYDSFSLIGASVLLVIALSKLNFKNKFINILGGASLGCYMLQDGSFGNSVVYPFLHNTWINGVSPTSIIFTFLLIFVLLWIVAIIITPLFKSVSQYLGNQIASTKLVAKILKLSFS